MDIGNTHRGLPRLPQYRGPQTLAKEHRSHKHGAWTLTLDWLSCLLHTGPWSVSAALSSGKPSACLCEPTPNTAGAQQGSTVVHLPGVQLRLSKCLKAQGNRNQGTQTAQSRREHLLSILCILG